MKRSRRGESYWTQRRTIKENTAAHMQEVQNWLSKIPSPEVENNSTQVDTVESCLHDEEQFEALAIFEAGSSYNSIRHEHIREANCAIDVPISEHLQFDQSSLCSTGNLVDIMGTGSNTSPTIGEINANASDSYYDPLDCSFDGSLSDSEVSSWYSYVASDYDPIELGNSVTESAEDPVTDHAFELAKWATDFNITHTALRNLLKILQASIPTCKLPRDPRSLLGTQRQYNIKKIDGGLYYHFGIAKGISEYYMECVSHVMQLRSKLILTVFHCLKAQTVSSGLF